VLGLPLIKNEKTVDPADPSSVPVVQIECAMGAAVEVFEGATAIGVGRERFLPVKTDQRPAAAALRLSTTWTTPSPGPADRPGAAGDLDSRYYKTISPSTPGSRPGAVAAAGRALTVEGDWTSRPSVTVVGRGRLSDEGARWTGPRGRSGRLTSRLALGRAWEHEPGQPRTGPRTTITRKIRGVWVVGRGRSGGYLRR
jgi:UTP--glucose-1-phosphate uridylyltransferase